MGSITEHISQKIKELRESADLTQTALAKKLDVAPNTVSRWENGTYKPSLEDLDELARFFDKPIWVFLPGELKPPTESHRALLRAAGDLPASDIDEMVRYADFVRARHALRASKKK